MFHLAEQWSSVFKHSTLVSPSKTLLERQNTTITTVCQVIAILEDAASVEWLHYTTWSGAVVHIRLWHFEQRVGSRCKRGARRVSVHAVYSVVERYVSFVICHPHSLNYLFGQWLDIYHL